MIPEPEGGPAVHATVSLSRLALVSTSVTVPVLVENDRHGGRSQRRGDPAARRAKSTA